MIHQSVVDPGFPEEGAPIPQGGAPTYDFAKISWKLHEIERIWTPGVSLAPPPPRSATASVIGIVYGSQGTQVAKRPKYRDTYLCLNPLP